MRPALAWRAMGLGVVLLLGGLGLRSASIADAGRQPPPLQFEGVTLNGGEFGGDYKTTPWLGGAQRGVDYTYPRPDDIRYFAQKGMNLFRIPFKARHVVGDSGQEDLEILLDLARAARDQGAFLLLDMHDYGYTRSGLLIGVDPGSVEEFAEQWRRIAQHFMDQPNVVFGLMCEPNRQTAAEWLQGVNAAIDAIRRQGAMQLILAPGSYWDGATDWTTTDNAAVIGASIVDPAENYAIEVHHYLDPDHSGSTAAAVPGSGTAGLRAITDWARSQQKRLFLGEFGFASDPASLAEGDELVGFLHANRDVWLGSAYWGAGPWWGTYMFSVEPDRSAENAVVDKPQMAVLTRFLQRTRVEKP